MKKIFFSTVVFSLLLTFTSQAQNLKREWMLVSFNNYSKEFLTKNKAKLDLRNPKLVPLFMGCNSISISVEVLKHHKLKFKNGIRTEMFCENAMQLEDDFLKDIELYQSYSIKGHSLTLKTPKGKKMIFIASDWD